MANYSQQDFIDTYEDLLAIITSSTTKWNPKTTNESDPGLIIVKLLALLEDKFNYKFDMAVAQGYIDTVSDIESAQDLFRMLGYIMKSARSSQGRVGIKIKEALVREQVIPRHSFITNATKTVKFFTLAETVIPQITLPTEAIYIQVASGEPFQITKSGISEFVLKDIDEDGRLTLGRTGLAQNGVFVYTVENNGVTLRDDWTYQDLLLTTAPGEKYYTVSTLQSSENYIQFPKDFETLIRTGKIVVYATYTEGSATNIAKNTLSRFEDSELSQLFYVSQTEDFDNGQDSESIKQAEINYYRQKDLCNTIITANDFRTAVLNLSDLGTGRRYSNAIVKTEQDRALKIRAKYNGRSFYDIIPSLDPAYQVDVTALTNRESYSDSFKIAGGTVEGTTITSELSNYTAVFTKAKSFNNDTTGDNFSPLNARLLAVTKPTITVRISGYTDAKAINIKQSIKDRLHSRFRADYLTPGEEPNYTEIINIIKSTSSAIQSVSMEKLDYNTYLNYKNVDGSAVDNTLAIANGNIVDEIINRVVLAGEVPLFRYSNRPNTLSKRASMYTSLLASSQAIEENDLEVTVPTPFSTPEGGVNQIAAGAQTNPVIVVGQLMESTAAIEPIDGINYSKFALSDNLLFQTRKQLVRDLAVYGFGMSYLFYSPTRCTLSEDTVIGVSTILETSKLKSGSVIKPSQDITLFGQGGEIEISANDDYTLGEDITIVIGNLSLTSATLMAGSEICPGSSLGGTEFKPYVNVANSADYKLGAGEELIIADSAGTVKDRLESGDIFSAQGMGNYFYVSGIREPQILDFSGTSFSTTQSITVREPDVKKIDLTKYNYILSRPRTDNLVLTTSGYMLEEEEFFIYTDLSKAEHVILGPGTVLKSKTGTTTLISTSLASVNDIEDRSNFNVGTSTITFSSFELSTYTTSNARVLIKRGVEGEALMEKHVPPEGTTTYSISNTWQSLVAGGEVIIQIKNESGEWENKTTLNNTFYEARLVGVLISDEFGIARLPGGMELTLGDISTSTDGENSVIASSVPFKKVITGAQGDKLFSEGITAKINMIYTTQLPSTDFSADIGADYISLKAIKNEAISITVPMIEGTAVAANLSVILPEGIDFDPVITVRGSTDGGTNYVDLYPLAVLEADKDGTTDITGVNATDYVGREVTIDLSNIDYVKVEIAAPEAGKSIIGIVVRLANLSYIEDFSKELKSESAEAILSDFSAVLTTIKEAANGGEDPTLFNWLDYPKEELEAPLEAASFFNKKHPLNKNTFPYIELIDRQIKVIEG